MTSTTKAAAAALNRNRSLALVEFADGGPLRCKAGLEGAGLVQARSASIGGRIVWSLTRLGRDVAHLLRTQAKFGAGKMHR
jgi:hypothetical protein